MEWDVEGTDEFVEWFDALGENEQSAVMEGVDLLQVNGPALGFPRSSGIRGSRITHLRELRIQSGGRALRVLYAFDPRRSAILLLGGDKTGDGRWYERHIPIAERLYDTHLRELRDGGEI